MTSRLSRRQQTVARVVGLFFAGLVLLSGPAWALEGACTNGIDDDLDGLLDCVDPDCHGLAFCSRESCVDRFDNDSDGAVDCDDSDCTGEVACYPDELVLKVNCHPDPAVCDVEGTATNRNLASGEVVTLDFAHFAYPLCASSAPPCLREIEWSKLDRSFSVSEGFTHYHDIKLTPLDCDPEAFRCDVLVETQRFAPCGPSAYLIGASSHSLFWRAMYDMDWDGQTANVL